MFEITETALIEETEVAVTLAEHLRKLGCRFALDDFGSGYGGFSVGIAYVSSFAGLESDQLIERADQATYLAKKCGGDALSLPLARVGRLSR